MKDLPNSHKGLYGIIGDPARQAICLDFNQCSVFSVKWSVINGQNRFSVVRSQWPE